MSNRLMSTYDKLKNVPGGKLLFSKLVSVAAPYTGTINAKVVELSSGHAKLKMADRRKVRNHLKSIHAIALMNFAEVTSGLAMLYGLPRDARGILKGLSIDYLKKARGDLYCECECSPPKTNKRSEHQIEAKIFDSDNDLVASARAHWLIGPKNVHS